MDKWKMIGENGGMGEGREILSYRREENIQKSFSICVTSYYIIRLCSFVRGIGTSFV
jgi:hypothetical protein